MSLGVGLGSFMEGMQSGMAMRERIDNRNLQRENRQRMAQIDTDARETFDDKVAQGQMSPDQFEEFWISYALPRKRNELLRQGDYRGARALQEWGQSDEAIQGGRLFASALLKAQTGDAAGALQDAIRAGQVKGYIDHGYELKGQQEIRTPEGELWGFRLTGNDAEGKEFQQDVPLAEIPRMVATFANPEAAWETQQAARAAQQKREQDLSDFERREEIKASNAPRNNPDYAEQYRKAFDDLMKNDLDFAELSEEEQDARVRALLDRAEQYDRSRRGGENRPPEPQRITVDRETGQQVGIGVDPTAEDAGRATDPASAADGAREERGGLGGALRRAHDGVREIIDNNPWRQGDGRQQQAPAPAPSAGARPNRDQVLAEARAEISRGGNPQAIAQRLSQAGVARAEWPNELRGALAREAPGIGGGR